MATFSYHVLKNIFSHLDIQKRLQISVYCPELKTAERNADLYLEEVSFHKGILVVNCYVFVVVNDEEDDIQTNPREVTTKVPFAKHERIFKKAIDVFFAYRGYGYIKIERFLLLGDHLNMIQLLPKDLKMDCRTLYLQDNNVKVLQAIRPFLINLPLERLNIQVTKPEDPILQDKLVRGAKHVRIRIDSDHSIAKDLIKLRSPFIEIEQTFNCKFGKDDLMEFIENWLLRCPEIGTKFRWNTEREDQVQEVINWLENQMGATEKEDGSLVLRSGNETICFKKKEFYFKMEVVR